MRKPHIVKFNSMISNQRGFTLFMVLIVMMVIAFMVVASTQTYNTERRVSTNDADRKYAFQAAEDILRVGENAVFEAVKAASEPNFTADCQDGWCESSSNTQAAWERDCGGELCIEKNGVASGQGRYIVERVDKPNGIYRVTVRAKGQNENTVVVLQSYLQVVGQ